MYFMNKIQEDFDKNNLHRADFKLVWDATKKHMDQVDEYYTMKVKIVMGKVFDIAFREFEAEYERGLHDHFEHVIHKSNNEVYDPDEDDGF